jgi:hypothetical protein
MEEGVRKGHTSVNVPVGVKEAVADPSVCVNASART